MEQENSVEFTPLTFDEILEDRDYQAEFDRRVQKAINTAKSKWEASQVDTSVGINDAMSNELSSLRNEISGLKGYLAQRDAREKDMMVRDYIADAIKEKEFVNDYTKDAIIDEIKTGLYSDANATVDGLLDEITKDKQGIFVNPNAPEIPTANSTIYGTVDKEAFNKMGYKERLELKQENPELFHQLNEK